MNKRNKFWCYNWLVIVAVGLLFWICYRYWSLLYSHSPLLILAHVFLLYLLVLKLLLNNIKCFNRLLDGASVSGWSFFKEFIRPFAYVYRKCGAGIDLLTRRMGAEQELIIAEKERKKLEVVLSQRELYEKLAQYPVPPKDDPGKEERENGYPRRGQREAAGEADTLEPKKKAVPPYARYGQQLLDYLNEVNWEHFSVTQAQLVLHKRFGTTKLVLEELVEQGELGYVRVGTRLAYTRLKSNTNN